MRIAYLTQPYPPMVSGASIVAEQLAKAMAARGHEVLVIAASETGHPYIEKLQNLSVIRLKSIRNPVRVNQRIMFMQRREVLQALHQFKPDVIHIHEPLQMGLAGLKYANHAGIPITMTSHQLPWFIGSYLPDIHWLQAWTEKLVWKYAGWLSAKYTVIISPTRTIANIIEGHTGILPKTINYGVDFKTFNPNFSKEQHISVRAEFKIPAGAPIILHTGRLDTDKHVERILLASANTIKKSGAHLLIVGDGCEKSRLVKLCKSLDIGDQVHFSGFVSNKEDLARIYRSANVFVTASEIETQGMVIVEACACGLPIVAVHATCIPEIVSDGQNGYLTAPGDIHAMSDAIEKILHNPYRASLMKINSTLVAEKYNIETSFAEHEELYHQIVVSGYEYRKSLRFRKHLLKSNK